MHRLPLSRLLRLTPYISFGFAGFSHCWFFQSPWVPEIRASFDDMKKVAPMGSEQGTMAMMVLSYWDQACALLNYGLLHEDLFFETGGEFFGVWERVKPIVPQARELFVNKNFLGHLEKAVQRYEAWSEKRNPGNIAGMRQFMKQMREQMASSAKA